MLRKYNQQRTFKDNMKLGIFTAFIAGMVNVASLVLFFSFTSNVTGHFAILATEIANGKWFQVVVVFFWIFLFFIGSFISNQLIIRSTRKTFISHLIPMGLEVICFLIVGVYGVWYYQETLMETELLVSLLLFSMGLQNGLTSSISNFGLKTTHLTGLTTDLAIHISLLTKSEYRRKKEVVEKTKLLAAIAIGYLIGGVLSGIIIYKVEFMVFFYISAAMVLVLAMDYSIAFFPTKAQKRSKVKRNFNGKLTGELGENS